MIRIRKIRVAALAVPVAMIFVAGTALADPVLVEAMGLDVWHIGQLENDLRTAERADRRLERELQAVLDRTGVHNLILDDVVAGRLSLSDAARQKCELNRGRSVLFDHLKRYRFGPTVEAKMAHDLLVMACERNPGERPAEMKRRLATEYRVAYGVAAPE